MNLAHSAADRQLLDRLVDGALATPAKPRSLRAFLDDVEAGGFAPRAFTALLALRPRTACAQRRLLVLLARLNAADSPLLATYGVRRVQLCVLEHATPDAPFGALSFSCVHEGDREEVLYELLSLAGRHLDRALSFCRDYPGRSALDACVRQLMAAAVERRLTDLLRDPMRVELARDRMSWLERGRAWLQERLSALAPTQANDVRELLPYGTVQGDGETPEQQLWVRRGALVARHAFRSRKRAARRLDPGAQIRRGFHAKHHGLVRARFVVRDDLPEALSRGVFQPGRSYDAWIRVSNLSGQMKPDSARDARGLAIKLEHVGFGADGQPQLQDFLLASHPVFFTKDARDYTLFNSFSMARDKRAVLLRAAVFCLRRPREVAILFAALSRRIAHPLGIEYHSMSGYSFGPHDAVKYLVRPHTPLELDVPPCTQQSDDFLRERLRNSLLPGPHAGLTLDFCLVIPTGSVPVEDARADWSEQSRVVPVATLEIGPQDPCSPERMQAAEELVFSPWHALPVHRPLGSLARARLAVYRESVAAREARLV